jgi:hypothetical protein
MIHGGDVMPALTTSTSRESTSPGARWGVTSACIGWAVWLLAPFVPVGSSPSLGSIEHVFLFMPLVTAPLALLLLSVLLGSGSDSSESICRAARRAQPVAAAMGLSSFFLPNGTLAGALASGWLVVAVMIAIGGARRAAHAPGRNGANVSLLAAHVFLPIGAAWLLLSRLGIAPRDLSALTVFLATVHFHFSGFTLQILIAATGLQLPDGGSWPSVLHRALANGAAAGIPLIAAGNIGHSPVLKFLGVSVMVASTLALAITSTAVSWHVAGRATRLMLLVSAASITAAMILAGVYGVGELIGRPWIGMPRMVAIHGLLNALGFTLFGLLGHLRSVLPSNGPPVLGGHSRR